MALANLLIHQVEVYRRRNKTDRLGQNVDLNPSQVPGPPVATYPCRLTRGKGGLVMQERSADVFEVRYVIYTMPGVDITEQDAVRVLDGAGHEIMPKAKILNKAVSADGVGTHHLEFTILAQRGPT